MEAAWGLQHMLHYLLIVMLLVSSARKVIRSTSQGHLSGFFPSSNRTSPPSIRSPSWCISQALLQGCTPASPSDGGRFHCKRHSLHLPQSHEFSENKHNAPEKYFRKHTHGHGLLSCVFVTVLWQNRLRPQQQMRTGLHPAQAFITRKGVVEKCTPSETIL